MKSLVEKEICCPLQEGAVVAMIDGKEVTMNLLRPIYRMGELKKAQQKLLEHVDKAYLLDEIFHFAKPEIFFEAGITLYDYEGKEVTKASVKENSYVHVPTSGTYWRLEVDDVLKNVQIHDFKDVEEFAKATGTTNLLSRGLDSKEKMGFAALATGNEAYNAVYKMALTTDMPGSTAEHYLAIRFKTSTTTLMTMGIKVEDVPELGRTPEEAMQLFRAVENTFGKNNAKKRYAIKAINTVIYIRECSLDEMLDALKTIPADELHKAQMMKCGEKESCIAKVLIKWMTKNVRDAA